MKQKLYYLLALTFLLLVGGGTNVVLADANTTLISGITLPSLPSGTYEGGTEVIHKNSNKAVVCDKDGNSVMQASSPGYGDPTAANFTWANAYSSSDGSWSTTGTTWEAPANSIFVGSSAYNNSSSAHNVAFERRCNLRNVRTFAYRFTKCGGVSALVKSQGNTSGAGAVLAVYQVGASDALTLVDSRTSITKSVDVITVDGLNKDNTYVAYIYGENGSNGELYEIAFLAPPSATAPTFSTNLPATANVGVGSSKTFTVASSNAVSYQWYKGSSSTANPASDTQLGTGASYNYTAPNTEGTEYIYCVATNENGNTTSNVCTVTVAEFQTVTFGLTRPLTKDPNDVTGTTGTMGDNVWNTADDTFTLTEVMGDEVSIDGGNRDYVIDDVTYTATESYKKGVNRSSFDEAQYAGYSFVIPDGKKLDITQVDARLSDASNCTWTWKIEVQDADGNTLWNTGDRTTNPKSTTTASISDNSLVTKLAGLVSGTYYAKIYFYQGGTTKCNTIDLTFTGNLKDADATAPTVTIASEQTMVKDAANTITSVVQAYPEATAYQWYSCDDAQGTNPVAVEGQTTSTLTVTPSAVGTLYYYLAATNSAGTTNSNVCTVSVYAEAEFSDFAAILNNGTGTLITSDEIQKKSSVSFGISVDGEGNAVRVAADSPMAFATVSGKYHSEHGLENFRAVVKVPGNVKIKLGTCNWGGNVTIKNSSNETVATANTNNGTCYHGNTSANKVTVYYEGEATTLTIEGGNYVPFISIEAVGKLSKYNVTFKNGEETVDTRTVYNDGVEAQAIGTLPEVTAAQGKRFRGWYVASDGSEGKVAVSTVPSSDVSYYAVFMDIPVATAGYYMPNNGLELANVLEYIEETSATSAKIFLKNGTYTLPRGASRHYTHKHSQTSAVLWDGDAYDPITYLKSSNVSFIGQSRDNVVITNNIPNTQEYIFSGQYGNANIYEGIGQSDVIQIDGNVSGLYWQDLTVSTGMEDGYGRDIAIQDKGTNNIYKNVSLYGYQDTWTSNKDNGLYYFEGGVVRGRTDYLCGKGDIYFNGVELRQLKGGYAAVPSKPANVGWVFKDCVINGDDAGVDGNYTLGRPWGKGTPVAVFIDTKMNVKPSAIGWSEMSDGWPARFAEYNSVDANGEAISLTGRKTTFASSHANNPVLTAEEVATYSDMNSMYGNWNPTQYTEQATVSNVKLNGSTLSWEGTSDAYLIEKNGEFVALTSEASYTVSGPGNYTVRAANARGGFGVAEEATGGKVTMTWNIAVGTSATDITSEQTSSTKIISETSMSGIYASKSNSAGKDNLSVKLTSGTAETAAATVTFDVPTGYAFIPYTAKAKVQPVTNNAMVKLTLSDESNTMSNNATSFKQGTITTSMLTANETKYYTGTVTLGIYCYDNIDEGYRLGTPITVSGELVPTVKITPTGYATFSSAYPLDFTEEIEGLDAAYYASAVAKGSVTMTELKQTVPASTGLFLKGTPNATVYIPVAEAGTEINGTNYLKPNTTATEVAASTAGTYHYVFAYNNDAPYNPGFFNLGSSVNLGACKAYVETTEDIKPAAQAKVSILFMDAEPTGINDVRVTTPKAQGETYNLGGQRVGNGYKGIVIVNGKKVLK